MENREKACCFTGHRNLGKAEIPFIHSQIDTAITSMLEENVTDFITGGAVGFDMMAAQAVI